MRILLRWILSAVVLALPAAAEAHDPDLSPAAKVSQRVGDCEITVEYNRPAVRKRRIWGALVPYGQPWRTGANASTKVTFSKDVEIGDQAVPAGSYSLLTIPGPKTWTLILNKNTAIRGDMQNYKQEEDVLRMTTAPRRSPPRERLTFIFSEITGDGAVVLDLEWEKLRVSIPMRVKAG